LLSEIAQAEVKLRLNSGARVSSINKRAMVGQDLRSSGGLQIKVQLKILQVSRQRDVLHLQRQAYFPISNLPLDIHFLSFCM
jgi:hypothetical protein